MDSHPSVVRYYTAWIEEMQPFIYEKIKDIDAMQPEPDMNLKVNYDKIEEEENDYERMKIPELLSNVKMHATITMKVIFRGYWINHQLPWNNIVKSIKAMSIDYNSNSDSYYYDEYDDCDDDENDTKDESIPFHPKPQATRNCKSLY